MYSKTEAWKMFDKISSTYDRVNTVLSFGFHKLWRKNVAHFLPKKQKLSLLDCATGTADQLIALMDRVPEISRAVGIDLSQEMLLKGKEKVKKKPYVAKVSLQHASATDLPFASSSFDCVTLSFGIRNIPDSMRCLEELYRVLKPGGHALILEFSFPKNKTLKALHLWYLRHLLPRIGGLLSKDKNAYRYLNETIETFPYGNAFCALLQEAGFRKVHAHPWTLGVVTLYVGEK